MRIKSKTLQVVIEHDVTVGNTIEATLVHIGWISENKLTGEIEIELDFTDIDNVKFMGMPIEDGYNGYKKFKETMKGIGIDIEKLMDEKAAQVITDDDMNELRQLYKSTMGI